MARSTIVGNCKATFSGSTSTCACSMRRGAEALVCCRAHCHGSRVRRLRVTRLPLVRQRRGISQIATRGWVNTTPTAPRMARARQATCGPRWYEVACTACVHCSSDPWLWQPWNAKYDPKPAILGIFQALTNATDTQASRLELANKANFDLEALTRAVYCRGLVSAAA